MTKEEEASAVEAVLSGLEWCDVGQHWGITVQYSRVLHGKCCWSCFLNSEHDHGFHAAWLEKSKAPVQ